MKRIFFMFVVLVQAQLVAADAVREGFIGSDNAQYYLRPASESDLDNPDLEISAAIKENRKERVRKNYFGVFVIEDQENKIVGKFLTGRMPLGVQPWSEEKNADSARLDIICDFYQHILNIHGKEYNPEFASRSDGQQVKLVNNSCHAATAVISSQSPFNTTHLVDALARLNERIDFEVAPDENISPAGKPFCIISIGSTCPECPEESTSRVFANIPYYQSKTGLRYTTVTSLENCEITELPEETQEKIGEYMSTL